MTKFVLVVNVRGYSSLTLGEKYEVFNSRPCANYDPSDYRCVICNRTIYSVAGNDGDVFSAVCGYRLRPIRTENYGEEDD